jgi:hypothetical protein
VKHALDIVGGKHDGVRGLYWEADAEHPPPNFIVVGTCPGRGECQGGNSQWCRVAADLLGLPASASRHPAYWTPDEDYLPIDGLRYRLTTVRRTEETPVAVYVQAGVPGMDPRAARETKPLTVEDILKAKLPEPVTAAGRAMSLLEAVRVAQGFGLQLTTGEHLPCRCSWHLPSEIERQTYLPPGRHDRGWA